YKKEVVDYMIAEYKTSRTPNPDVMCNKEIKFGAFLDWAKKQGVDFIATGHYARIYPKLDFGQPQSPTLGSTLGLLESKDKNKDQSYFLWTLTQEQLKYVLFPVGHLQKEEVRKLAKQFGLPQATRKDSQGLCFLGQVDMKEFLSRYIKQKMGNVLNKKGEIIGYHNGAAFFTIGERHGFIITKKNPNDKPLYVASKDIAKNTITVSKNIITREKSQRAPLTLKSVNWISGRFPQKKDLFCRLRYRQNKVKCKAQNEKGKIKVLLQEENYLPAQAGISPGQSLVFYNGEECLGGGIVQ
ncbi:MAG: tRNA 2-thiouridine(34) synthase MnmA, partial [Patescibacteria group bacterium]